MNNFEEMAQSMRALMLRLEQLIGLLHKHELVYWPDWGTLLGVERHSNVIPWDYDVDLCMPAADYQRLLGIFAQNGGQIGELVLHKDYYGDPQGACALLFADVPDESLGIDLVSYTRAGSMLRNDMSLELQANYPGKYDMPAAQILPLRWGHLLGQPVLLPQHPRERLADVYGDWQTFPPGQAASALTEAPFLVIPDADDAAPLAGPRIARAHGRAPLGENGWSEPGYAPGTRSIRWLAAADALAADLTWQELQEASFTELVFRNDRGLWGKIQIGTLFPGDRLICATPGLLAEDTSFGQAEDE